MWEVVGLFCVSVETVREHEASRDPLMAEEKVVVAWMRALLEGSVLVALGEVDSGEIGGLAGRNWSRCVMEIHTLGCVGAAADAAS